MVKVLLNLNITQTDDSRNCLHIRFVIIQSSVQLSTNFIAINKFKNQKKQYHKNFMTTKN